VNTVLFHVPNFRYLLGSAVCYPSQRSALGRFVLTGEGWNVTVDARNDIRDCLSVLDDNSGYAMTHVGRLEKDDGTSFDTRDATRILEGLWWFLSFVQGRWTGPLLPVGFDATGRRVWECWHAKKVAPWSFHQTWVDDHHPEQPAELFPGFLRRWLDSDWNQVVRLAIHWYIEANAQAGAIEGAIVLCQSAFELLAWSIIVDDTGQMSAGEFDRLSAADKISHLLSWAGVPVAIPTSQSALQALALAKGWADAPVSLTRIRNPITHPSRRNRDRFQDYPPSARTEAWNLGLWLLEMCILRLCDYKGSYGNRLIRRFKGDVERVPWVP
jgi:hypothetical protein